MGYVSTIHAGIWAEVVFIAYLMRLTVVKLGFGGVCLGLLVRECFFRLVKKNLYSVLDYDTLSFPFLSFPFLSFQPVHSMSVFFCDKC